MRLGGDGPPPRQMHNTRFLRAGPAEPWSVFRIDTKVSWIPSYD